MLLLTINQDKTPLGLQGITFCNNFRTGNFQVPACAGIRTSRKRFFNLTRRTCTLDRKGRKDNSSI